MEEKKYYTIDEETGEIIESEGTNQLMARELYELGTDLEDYEELEAKLDYFKEQIETWKKDNREKIKNILKKYNQKSIQTPNKTYTIVDEGYNQVADTEKMKRDGIYDKYSKLTLRKEQLRITRRK